MYTLAQAKEYFATYYAPNNITGVLAGDFRAEEVKPLLERYFGRIPRGEIDPPPVVTLEPEQIGEKRYNAEAETSPTVRIWWKGVPFVHRDMPVLDLLSDVLTGRTGRLYKGLVDGRKIANQVSASVDTRKYDGIFMVEVTVKDGEDPAAVEAAVYEEIERLQAEPIPAEELQKVKNRYKAFAYRRLVSPTSHRPPAAHVRRARRLALHQHLGRADRGGHRRGPAAGGEGVPDEGAQSGRGVPAQGGRRRRRTRRWRPCPRRRRPWCVRP